MAEFEEPQRRDNIKKVFPDRQKSNDNSTPKKAEHNGKNRKLISIKQPKSPVYSY
jgi:hypothetical protein